MKKYFLSLAIIGFLTIAGTASAQMGMMGNYGYGDSADNTQSSNTTQNQEITSALQDIYTVQNINNKATIDCSKVTDGQFEKLGDAYMAVMLPNKQQHEAMDNMMGGEGSSSLTEAHINNMGRSFLGCWSDYNSGPVYMMPMMGGYGQGGYTHTTLYPMMYEHFGYQNMMEGWGWWGVGSMVLDIVWFVLAAIGLVVVGKWIITILTKK